MYRQQYPDAPGMHNAPLDAGYTRVHYAPNPSFCDRVRNGLVGVVIGLILIVLAAVLLFWNEGRAVQTARSLEEGLDLVVPLHSPEVSSVLNDGKLVHLTAPLRTGQLLYDRDYEVAVPCVKMRRVVEVYQWVEHESKDEIQEGDGTRIETSYSYSTEWRSGLVDSRAFHNGLSHSNPTQFIVTSTDYTATDAKVAAFQLTENLVNKVKNYVQFRVTDPPHTNPYLVIHDGMFYHARDPLYPTVGDTRVKFEYAGYTGDHLGSPDVVSIIARQSGERLTEYQTSAGDSLQLLYMGDYTPAKMFGNELVQNSMITWGLRIGGWLLMFIGFISFSQIFTAVVDWIPIVRDLVALGTMTLCACFSISLSLTVIALGWIRYRPLLGCTVLFSSLLPFIFSKMKASARHRSRMD